MAQRGFFTSARVDDAVLLFQQGMRVSEIAVRFGCNADNLSKALRARGVDTSRRVYRPAHNRKDVPEEELVAKYRAGASELALAEEYGINRRSIRQRLLKHGVECRGRQRG